MRGQAAITLPVRGLLSGSVARGVARPGSTNDKGVDGKVACRSRLGGILNFYHREASLSLGDEFRDSKGVPARYFVRRDVSGEAEGAERSAAGVRKRRGLTA
jgi:hypothetical protein